VVRAQQNCRHQDDGRHRIGDSQVAPFDPVARAEAVGHRKGSAPKGGSKGNEHHRDEDEGSRVTKGKRLEGGLNQDANPGRRRDGLRRVENFAVQCVQRRPLRLLGGDKMRARGGQRVGPPVPRGDQQQDGNKGRVRGEEEGDFAVGETEGPRDPRGDVIASGAGQDAARRTEKCPAACRLPGIRRSRRLAVRLFRPRVGHLSRAAFVAAGPRATRNRSFRDENGRLHRGVHASASSELKLLRATVPGPGAERARHARGAESPACAAGANSPMVRKDPHTPRAGLCNPARPPASRQGRRSRPSCPPATWDFVQ
jgi:hypothetical protein